MSSLGLITRRFGIEREDWYINFLLLEEPELKTLTCLAQNTFLKCKWKTPNGKGLY